MRAGRLRHRITIEADEADPEQPADDGTVTPDWQPIHTNRPAEVLAVSGGEILRGGIQVAATTSHTIRIRYVAGISPEARILWNGLTLGVTHVHDVDGRTRELLIEAESAK